MLIQPILLLIILQHLRKYLVAVNHLPKWEKWINISRGIAVAIMVLYATVKDSRQVLPWVSDIFLFGLAYLVYFQKEFRSTGAALNAFLPLIIIFFIDDVMLLLFHSWHQSWINYFEAAKLFGFIWMAAMLIINKRQRKALEKERLKAEEKEKEFRITEKIKAELEVQVKERTAELTKQKEELQQTLTELKATQSQLIQSEKMASLGELTAGIAHEIQNPLNFVNNFSEVNTELINEMKEAITKGDFDEVKSLANDIADNEQKINHHGKRADGIVKGMLQHSRSSTGIKEPTDINALADEYLRLAYHGLRAKDKSFNATMKTDYDESIGNINVIPQDMGRVILNLITNAFYAVDEKKASTGSARAQGIPTFEKGFPTFEKLETLYEPTVSVSTKKTGAKVFIAVKDNGNGIPKNVLDKIFQPFFTTKPTGEGTGLGLSMSYDIVTKGHGGELKVETMEGEGSTFVVVLPVSGSI